MVDVNKKKAETDILIDKVNKESAIAATEQEIANEEETKTNEASNAAEIMK
jgi:dynein heavy chain